MDIFHLELEKMLMRAFFPMIWVIHFEEMD